MLSVHPEDVLVGLERVVPGRVQRSALPTWTSPYPVFGSQPSRSRSIADSLTTCASWSTVSFGRTAATHAPTAGHDRRREARAVEQRVAVAVSDRDRARPGRPFATRSPGAAHVDRRVGVREVARLPLEVDGRHRHDVRQRRRVLERVALGELVAGRRDQQHARAGRALELGGLGEALLGRAVAHVQHVVAAAHDRLDAAARCRRRRGSWRSWSRSSPARRPRSRARSSARPPSAAVAVPCSSSTGAGADRRDPAALELRVAVSSFESIRASFGLLPVTAGRLEAVLHDDRAPAGAGGERIGAGRRAAAEDVRLGEREQPAPAQRGRERARLAPRARRGRRRSRHGRAP